MSEVEVAPVPETVPDDALPERRSLLERLIEQDHVKAIEKIESMTKVLEHLRLASIRSTYPTDWVIHAAFDKDGNKMREVGYLMDCGAERAGKVWGIEVEQPIVEREDFRDDDPPTFAYNMIAEARSKVTGERNTYEGSRWSGDKFFTSRLRDGERQDPVEIRKAAYANLHGRAVRALGGLKDVPIDMLKQAGIDTTKVLNISYGAGSSSAAVGTSDPVIKWGNCQGKKVSELADKDIGWYLEREEKNLADPAKERFKKNTQAMVNALKAEQEKRANAKTQEKETGTSARSADLTKLQERFREMFGKGNLKHVMPYLTATISRKVDALSDLTDAEIVSLLATPDDILKESIESYLNEQKTE
jgi:hypothetical protein